MLSLILSAPPTYTGQTTFQAVEEEMVRIDLGLDGNPLPTMDTLSWTFNNMSLGSGDGITLGLDFIEFSSVNRSNSGTYAVSSSNIAGNGSFEFNLEVFCELFVILASFIWVCKHAF